MKHTRTTEPTITNSSSIGNNKNNNYDNCGDFSPALASPPFAFSPLRASISPITSRAPSCGELPPLGAHCSPGRRLWLLGAGVGPAADFMRLPTASPMPQQRLLSLFLCLSPSTRLPRPASGAVRVGGGRLWSGNSNWFTGSGPGQSEFVCRAGLLLAAGAGPGTSPSRSGHTKAAVGAAAAGAVADSLQPVNRPAKRLAEAKANAEPNGHSPPPRPRPASTAAPAGRSCVCVCVRVCVSLFLSLCL